MLWMCGFKAQFHSAKTTWTHPPVHQQQTLSWHLNVGVSGDVHHLSAALDLKKIIKYEKPLINSYSHLHSAHILSHFSCTRHQHMLYIHLKIAAQQSELYMTHRCGAEISIPMPSLFLRRSWKFSYGRGAYFPKQRKPVYNAASDSIILPVFLLHATAPIIHQGQGA